MIKQRQRKELRKCLIIQINLVVYQQNFKAQGKSDLAQNKVTKEMINTNLI